MTPSKLRISVVIPSRLQTVPAGGNQRLMLERAISSIRQQTASHAFEFQILVGIDQGAKIPARLANDPRIRFAHSQGKFQAAALNAAARLIEGDFVAFLEDDDQWNTHFIEYGLAALADSDFTSSTQLEVGPGGEVICINDFPTPSGWLMHRRTWEAIGLFDESYKWHLDNDWLGRLGNSGLRRAHLVESTAPITRDAILKVGRSLQGCLSQGGPRVRLARHHQPYPLVRRLVHPASGCGQISQGGPASLESKREFEKLITRYGRLPW